jgi:RsiW-degrading membrane proteinase PrsW (M82 family)
MCTIDPLLLVLAAASATAWSVAGAVRLPGACRDVVPRALLGGGAAFGLALSAYDLLPVAGLEVRWETLLRGGWPALGGAALIGLVEEGAKLCGIALAVREPRRPAAVMGTTIGVCAAFAALETVTALSGAPAGLALVRAVLAPVAHAVLSVPIGFGVALAARRGFRAGAVVLPLALSLSAALHAAGDLALVAPRYGRLGFATVLLAPVVALFLHLRRLAPARVPAPAALRRDARDGPALERPSAAGR